ncbi:MAG: amino acid permease [Chromatiaceae bacterium]|nr:MAG: amino acid permease [Chromatiaceae bacterium]
MSGVLHLTRQVGLFGAVMLGLGAMIGTGVFVSIGIAAGSAGPAVLIAIVLAALVALCNGLSSAQLAANHPVSGGTYEYGYRYLTPALGFTAGWMFLLAKSASAATAALGFAGYSLSALELGSDGMLVLALAAVLALMALVLTGLRRSNAVNIAIVSISLATLLFFILAGAPAVSRAHFSPVFGSGADPWAPVAGVLHATALMFVAYTGYGRIATLGEEVRDPGRTIPRAIHLTLLVTMLLYLLVAAVGIGTLGAAGLSAAVSPADTTRAAPLVAAARHLAVPHAGPILALGAVTAMLGVLLNLILGLSRVLLAMGRRGDLPAILARLDRAQTTPYVAVLAVSLLIAGLVLIGDVASTWSFSAFTVLVYYALTNLAALRIPAQQRLYPRWIAAVGLLSCLFLAFWVEPRIWVMGLALLAAGLAWHGLARRWQRRIR